MTSRTELESLRNELRTRSLRATPSRIAVLELMRASDNPLSHAEAADRLTLKAWDRATIYRNLTDLADVGLLRRSDHGDHVWRFEAVRDDHGPEKHPHFVCVECGGVECLPGVELSMKKAAPRSVKTRDVEIQLRGVCDACG
jgi:Fur family transcriptional regulator, ferric uptake regulator